MDKLFLAYETAKDNTIKGDFIDRLHSRITVVILFFVCVVIGLKQYEGTQILCWLPTHFSESQTEYTHQLCWVNNTYYYPGVSDADLFPRSDKHTLLYYQYILFILFFQGLLFYLPTMIWNVAARDSIGYIKKILDQCQRSKAPKKVPKHDHRRSGHLKSRAAATHSEDTADDFEPLLIDDAFSKKFLGRLKSIVSFEQERPPNITTSHEEDYKRVDITPESYTKSAPHSDSSGLRHRGGGGKDSRSTATRVLAFMKPKKGVHQLATHYLLLKVLNLLNVLFQMFLLHFMFGHRFFFYGIDFVRMLLNNQNPFFLTNQFPIITFCDFYVHQNLRKIYYNAAQCVLPINVLIEKFFLIIWFWFYILIILTVINIISWLIELNSTNKLKFLEKYLTIRQKLDGSAGHHSFDSKERDVRFDPSTKSRDEMDEIRRFYEHYFGDSNDGLIMLHLIKSVAGHLIFMDLMNVLWNDFAKSQRINNNTSLAEGEQDN